MKRILVPINFSNTAENALRYAHFLSRHLNTSLTLLHCYSVQDYNRPYDFGKRDYSAGIKEMLSDFYQQHIDEPSSDVRFLAQPGSISKEIALISKHYETVILSSNKFSSKVTRWFGSKVTYIASQAQCPVLIIPTSENFSGYKEWKKIWHISRKENETDIIEKKLSNLKIDPNLIEKKTFNQTNFKSAFWRALVAYVQAPREELQQAIFEAKQIERIDLFLFVSHGKDSFEKFVKDDTIQIIFKFGVPVLIFQG